MSIEMTTMICITESYFLREGGEAKEEGSDQVAWFRVG
jgi:hypothetical protein